MAGYTRRFIIVTRQDLAVKGNLAAHAAELDPTGGDSGNSATNWLIEDTLSRPPALAANSKNMSCNAQHLGPFGDCSRLPLVGDSDVIPLVVALDNRSCPTAILRRVRTVNVNAISRMARRWPLPHIAQEMIKAVRAKPARINRDSSSAIRTVLRVCRQKAAASKPRPRTIFWRVCPVMPSWLSILNTPARLRVSIYQGCSSNLTGCSAPTTAQPMRSQLSIPSSWRFRYNSPSAKGLARQISLLCHVLTVNLDKSRVKVKGQSRGIAVY